WPAVSLEMVCGMAIWVSYPYTTSADAKGGGEQNRLVCGRVVGTSAVSDQVCARPGACGEHVRSVSAPALRAAAPWLLFALRRGRLDEGLANSRSCARRPGPRVRDHQRPCHFPPS